MGKIDVSTQKEITKSFLELFEEKLGAINNWIEFAEDKLIKVDFEIDKFYLEEDIFAGKQEISTTKITSDKLIDRKIQRYRIILGLISEKYKIIQDRVKNGFYTDEYDLVNKKIDLFKLQIEIHAKKEFLENYEKRKG
jgi:hypothetical protein